MPYETEQNLKSFLDSNQLSRERMCLAILKTDRRFTDVRPRHPRGGPDGGRDIEAIFEGNQTAFGAVGFVNQADDSKEKKKAIKKKFKDDLKSALSEAPIPSVFIFFTNVDFSVTEENALRKIARTKNIKHCEIFDRERIRIVLDSSDGFAIRFQYLSLPLSEAEQATFFAKWGDEIQSIISTGFQRIQNTLDRVLFLQESADVLTSLIVNFELERKYTAEEIGHFRAFIWLFLKEPKHNTMSIIFGSSDKWNRFQPTLSTKEDQAAGIKHGISGAQWKQDLPFENPQDDPEKETFELDGCSSSVGVKETQFISIRYSKQSFIRIGPMLRIADFNEARFLPFLNCTLAEKVKSIHVFANEYKLLEIPKSEFLIDHEPVESEFPVKFSEKELSDKWVRIRPNYMTSNFQFSYSEKTPVRTFSPQQTQHKSFTKS